MPILSWAALRGFLFTGILISATSTIFSAFLYPVQLYPVTSSSQHYPQDLRDFDSAGSDTQAEHEKFNGSAQKNNRWQEFGLRTAAGRILGLPSAEKTTFGSKLFSTRTWNRNKKASGNNNVQSGDRVALCLVGAARQFELTGPSILKFLLPAYPDANVFLSCPLDESSRKFSLFKSTPRLAGIKIFPVTSVNESAYPTHILRAADSPAGIQGLLQYFRLVEGCLDLILLHEQRHLFRYDWIVRTRVDGYWAAPPPPLSALNRSLYTVPYGSDWGGLNDRFGVGGRDASFAALSRLTLLPELAKLNYSNLNSEASFSAQLAASNISAARANFSFCIVSSRKYEWVTTPATPVASLGSKAQLNGAKCRPCTPRAVGAQVEKLLAKHAGPGTTRWIGPTSGVELCSAEGDWEPGWKKAFDKAVGKGLAQQRRALEHQGGTECSKDFAKVQSQADIWSSPPPAAICARADLGKVTAVAGQGVFLKKLSRRSIVYSVGLGPSPLLRSPSPPLPAANSSHPDNITTSAPSPCWEWDLLESVPGLPVLSFDPTVAARDRIKGWLGGGGGGLGAGMHGEEEEKRGREGGSEGEVESTRRQLRLTAEGRRVLPDMWRVQSWVIGPEDGKLALGWE